MYLAAIDQTKLKFRSRDTEFLDTPHPGQPGPWSDWAPLPEADMSTTDYALTAAALLLGDPSDPLSPGGSVSVILHVFDNGEPDRDVEYEVAVDA